MNNTQRQHSMGGGSIIIWGVVGQILVIYFMHIVEVAGKCRWTSFHLCIEYHCQNSSIFQDVNFFYVYRSRNRPCKYSRTSCRIYRLALPLRAPEMLSSLSRSRISIFDAHLTLFVRRMMSHNSIGKYHHLVNWLGTCLGTERRRWQNRQVESLQNWKEVNVGSSAWEEVRH